jgi:hypothetical protein
VPWVLEDLSLVSYFKNKLVYCLMLHETAYFKPDWRLGPISFPIAYGFLQWLSSRVESLVLYF